MKKLNLCKLLLLLPFFSNAQMTKEVVSRMVFTNDVNGGILKIPKFDTSLGRLLSVDIKARLTNKGLGSKLAVENINTSPATVMASKTLDYSLDILSTSSGTVTRAAAGIVLNDISVSLPAYDGTTDYGGSSGLTRADTLLDSNFAYSGDVPPFKGDHNDSMDILYVADINIRQSFSGSAFTSATMHEVIVNVTYHYTTSPVSLSTVVRKTPYVLFPNPAKGRLYIEGELRQGAYSVCTPDGRTMLRNTLQVQQSTLELDISRLAKGCYILLAPQGESVQFIVQ